MLSIVLWVILAVLIIILISLSVKTKQDHGIWKTKKDLSFNELDKLLESQDYKFEVNKYLHKYKSDRRWYENQLSREIFGIVLASIMILADIILILIFKAYKL